MNKICAGFLLWISLLLPALVHAAACTSVFPAATTANAAVPNRLDLSAVAWSSATLFPDSTLSLGAVDRYYGGRARPNNYVLNATGAVSTRIFVNGNLSFGNGADLNRGGNPRDLILIVNGSLTFGNNSEIRAIIYATGAVSFGNNTDLQGALTAQGGVAIGSGTPVYDSAAVNAANLASFCTPPPTLSVANASANEGSPVAFPLALSASSASAITVNYTVSAVSAMGGASCTGSVDFINTGGTHTISSGLTSSSIPITVCNDTVAEGDETFTLTLSSPTNAILGTASATGTILDDDFIADWRMDEVSWNGTANEVADSSGNGHHALSTRAAGATLVPTATSGTSAYTSGSQSTCNYGQFDTAASPVRTYGAVVPASIPALPSSFTFSAWIRTTNPARSGQRILVRDDAQNGWGFSLGDPGSGRIRLFNRRIGTASSLTGNGSIGCGGGTFCLDTATAITANNWFFVAVSINSVTRRISHYVFNQAGTLLSTTSAAYPNPWLDGTGALAIGGETAASAEGRNASFHFNGNIDEVRISYGALSQARIQSLMTRTRSCSGGVPDHYHLSHSGSGVTCEAEQVTITAHDASHNVFNVSGNTRLTVSTSPAVSGIVTTPVNILDGSSAATVNIQQSSALSNIDIDVVDDGGRTEPESLANHDPRLSFASASLRFYADGTANTIGSQIMDKSSATAPNTQTLTLHAVQANAAACEAVVTGVRNVDIGFTCLNPATCSATGTLDFVGNSAATVTGSHGAAPVSYTSVPLLFDASGIATFSFDANDSGLMQLHAQLSMPASPPNPAFTLTGSSNTFAVRPFGFDIDFSGQRAADYGDDGALNNSTGTNLSLATDADDPVFAAAGNPFTTTLRAVGWQVADDGDNDGIPDSGVNLSNNKVALNFRPDLGAQDVVLSSTLIEPVAGNDVALGGETSLSNTVFTNGVETLDPSWGEVGIIDLAANLNGYLGVSGLNITGTAPNVGRFRPAQFSVSKTDGSFANACGAFTYLGQPFTYTTVPSLTITAQDASGATTQNYTSGAFQKLVTGDIDRTFPVSDNAKRGLDAATLMAVTSTSADGVLTVTNPGEMTYTFDAADSFTYTRNANARIIPFNSDLSIPIDAVTDSETVAASSLPTVQPTAVNLRYGRWIMENAFGPELMPLAMTAEAQYLDDDGNFVLNILDNCTALETVATTSGTVTSGQAIAVGGGTSTFTYNATLSGGEGDFNFTAPGSGRTGTIPITVDLSSRSWLRFDWDGDGDLEDHPGASATFGQYRGHDRIIYWREVEN